MNVIKRSRNGILVEFLIDGVPQPIDQAKVRAIRPIVHAVRPGNLFSVVIEKITGKSAQACGRCGKRMRQMNEWGWWSCFKNRKTIIGWLCEEAARRGHRIEEANMAPLFKAAFRELRRKPSLTG